MSRATESNSHALPVPHATNTESSIGHSTNHAGFTSQPRPSFHRPSSTVGPAGGGGRDQYLHEAEGIKLTQEDKQVRAFLSSAYRLPITKVGEREQEGYDPDLLQLKPRNTIAAPDRPASPPPPLPNPVPASSLPYASRTRDGPVDRKQSKVQHSSQDANPEKSASQQAGVGRYPSRPSKDPRHRQARNGGGASKAKRSVPRRKRKELKWWQKPRTFIILIGGICVIGLAVGLGVGLTAGRKDERTPGNPEMPSSTNEVPNPTGIQPSASQALSSPSSDVTVAAIDPRPSPSIEARNRIVNFEYVGDRKKEQAKGRRNVLKWE
ncbi:hypothetical protein JCM5353_007087 [Sporobolomyces roseus]